LLSPDLHAAGGVFELLEHLAIAQNELEVGSLAASEGLAVDLAFEVDGHAVACLGLRRPAARWAKVRRCLRRISMVLSMASSVTSAVNFFDFGTGQIADLDFGVDLEHRVESHLTFRRRLRFSVMLGLAGDTQLGFVGGSRQRPRPPCRSSLRSAPNSRSAGPRRSWAPCLDESRPS